MDEIFHLLMLFDYPDAVTRGLRKKSDLARSMIERTRGDLTNAMEIRKVEALLDCAKDKFKESDLEV
jgi:translin